MDSLYLSNHCLQLQIINQFDNLTTYIGSWIYRLLVTRARALPSNPKVTHIYHIILKNYRVFTALFSKITACFPSWKTCGTRYFEKNSAFKYRLCRKSIVSLIATMLLFSSALITRGWRAICVPLSAIVLLCIISGYVVSKAPSQLW